MKVLIVSNSLATGGAEKLILDSIPLFNKQGINTELLLLNGQEHPFLKQLQKNSQSVVHTLSKRSVYNPFLIFKLIPFLKKFSVIHVHLFPSLYWVALAKVLSFSKTQLVFTEHNTTNRRKGFLFSITDAWVYKKYTKIVAITEEVVIELNKRVKNIASRIVVISNGVNLQKIQEALPANRNNFSITNAEKIILQVSSFTPQKDQTTLIKAMEALPQSVHLLLVGDGTTKAECVNLVKNLELESRVQFLGLRMDVPNLLKMVDIVVLSSHFEGLSLSSIEGMISGKPFVASSVPGLTQLVEGAGVLFPEGDFSALAKEINALLDDELYYKQIVSQCQQRAKEYSLDKMTNKYIELYKELWRNQN